MSRRDEYIEKMKQQLDTVNAEISRIEIRISETTGQAREKMQSELEKVRAGYEALTAKVDEVRKAGEETFEKYRDEAGHLWKVLNQSINYFKTQV